MFPLGILAEIWWTEHVTAKLKNQLIPVLGRHELTERLD